MVAFRQRDGSVAWQSGDFRNSASSPLLIDVSGEPQLVAFLYEEVTGFDPRDGRLLWRQPHVTEYGLNVSLPLWGDDGLLFVSAAYGGGSRVLHLTRAGDATGVEELWHSSLMRIHFGNALRLSDFVVASSGDFGPAPLTAIDVRTGQVLWRNRGLARASLAARRRPADPARRGRPARARERDPPGPADPGRSPSSSTASPGPSPRSTARCSTPATERASSPWT